MTHDRFAAEKCRSVLISGSAMFTMVASSTTMSWQVRIAASTSAAWLGRGSRLRILRRGSRTGTSNR